ncbi:MAG: Flp pilus assembly protein CpaB [Blastococcus sp.]|jgi:pilus assembly protein CpaB|nr:Flp pilus assembly protein CpaB [Blastococcus sp.]
MPHLRRLGLRRPRSPVHTARRAAAVLLAITAVVLALRPVRAPEATAPAVVPVAVAAVDLPAGSVLTGSGLTVARLPPEAVPVGAVADPDLLMGRTLAAGVRAREPLTDVRLVGAGLTALLPEGQVAAPVRLADLAVAALVRTGDRVDVLATRPDAPDAEVVADGVLVLAAPGVTANQETAPAAGLLLIAVDGATAARLAAAATTATLTVSLPPS